MKKESEWRMSDKAVPAVVMPGSRKASGVGARLSLAKKSRAVSWLC